MLPIVGVFFIQSSTDSDSSSLRFRVRVSWDPTSPLLEQNRFLRDLEGDYARRYRYDRAGSVAIADCSSYKYLTQFQKSRSTKPTASLEIVLTGDYSPLSQRQVDQVYGRCIGSRN
jgi:hypothetical protein